jgi:spectrin beta
LESQLKIKQQQVTELESSSSYLDTIDPDKRENIIAKKVKVEERFQKMLEPLVVRRSALERAKMVHQFLRDIEDENMWIAEKMPQATGTDYGNSLLGVQMLQKKNKSLRNEVEGHNPCIQNVVDTGETLIQEGHPNSDEFRSKIEDLLENWDNLQKAVDQRRQNLELSEIAQQVSQVLIKLFEQLFN